MILKNRIIPCREGEEVEKAGAYKNTLSLMDLKGEATMITPDPRLFLACIRWAALNSLCLDVETYFASQGSTRSRMDYTQTGLIYYLR